MLSKLVGFNKIHIWRFTIDKGITGIKPGSFLVICTGAAIFVKYYLEQLLSIFCLTMMYLFQLILYNFCGSKIWKFVSQTSMI